MISADQATATDQGEHTPDSESVEGSVWIRSEKSGDRNLILSSWLRSALQFPIWHEGRIGSPSINLPPGGGTPLHSTHQSILKKILDNSLVLVASDPEEEDHVFGYCVFEKDCLHWIYVKKDLRRMGLGSYLMARTGLGEVAEDQNDGSPRLRYMEGEIEVSHRTPALNHFKDRKFIWNPYRMWV
jgi:GNAT superfamily N-acetyltransferase